MAATRALIFAGQVRAFLAICLLVAIASLTSAVAAPRPRNVLVLDEPDPSSGNPTIFSTTLRATLTTFTPRVAVFGETLNLTRFTGPTHEAILRTYIEQKYSDVSFGVIVAVGASAFDLATRWRSELWPDVPIVFAAIDEMTAAGFRVDAGTTGIIMKRTIKSMMAAAHVLVPDLQGVAVLGGSLEQDPYRLQYRRELAGLAAETKLTNLTGSPLAVQVSRASALPDKTAILYTSLFIDDEGTRYSSSEALAAIAKVANRPIVVDVENLIGHGATGGFALNNVVYGREAAALALRILNGASIAENPVRVREFTQPVFDWRQLQRWSISESALPPGSEIRFRPTHLWEQYPEQILAICAVILLEAALIFWLIYEHRRRHLAEIQSRQSMTELAAMNRVATAGELSASIAHEVNQPLAGMVARANAALRWLAADAPNIGKARSALEQIVEAGHRAADIVKNVRAMFLKETEERTPVDINEIIRSVLALLYLDLRRHSIESQINLGDRLPPVVANDVQLQQVVLNLVMNAIDAMRSVEPRVLSIKSELIGRDRIHVSIEDTGGGIDPSNRDRIFKPMFSTKASGMGMGLSICRSIIENHGGRIWVSPAAIRGSIFQFEVPTTSDKNDFSIKAA